MAEMQNLDERVVAGFGWEWERFPQQELAEGEAQALFEQYFSIFPWPQLGGDAVGFDLGCGSGRWAKLVAPRVGTLHCIDPSAALEVARRNLAGFDNCRFHYGSANSLPLADNEADFGYSLGVLHHIPDPQTALRSCVAKLKPGAPFLLYVYYALDNRPLWFRGIWLGAEWGRQIISRLPRRMQYLLCDLLAAGVYWPLSRFARLLERCGVAPDVLPLAQYRHRSFYSLRTDALDRFATRLEHRFSRGKVVALMRQAGLENIQISAGCPYWTALGWRRPAPIAPHREG